MKIFLSLTFFVSGILMVLPFGVAHAVVLQPIADITIQNIQILKEGATSGEFAFDITNNEQVSFNDLYYGLRLQSDKGVEVYTVKGGSSFNLAGGTTINKTISFTAPKTFNGTYYVVATVTNRSGSTLTNAIVKTVTLKGDTTEPNSLKCASSDETNTQYTCAFLPLGSSINYSIRRGGPLGKEVQNGTATITNDGKSAIIDTGSLKGRFGIVTSLMNASGAILAQVTNTFISSDEWIVVSGIKQSPVVNEAITVDLFIDGSGESDNRGFVYAVLDDGGRVCSSGKTQLRNVIPNKHTIVAKVPSGCDNPTFAGFLYDGVSSIGEYTVVESFGIFSAQELIAKGIGENKISTQVNIWKTIQKNSTVVVLLGLFFVGIIIYIMTWFIRRKKGLLIAIFFVASVGMLGYAPSAQAATFKTVDNPNNATFTVNLTKNIFKSTEAVTFTFGIVHNGTKPSNSVVDVSVDGGTSTRIVKVTDTAITYAVSLNAVSTKGAHTLQFTVPGLCGSAFGYSKFGTATFGISDCTFSVPFSVTQAVVVNVAPSTPQIRVSCIVGANNTIGFRSVSNNKVYYKVNFYDGQPLRRVPTSGYTNPSPTYANTIYSGWTTSGAKSFSVQAIDNLGASSAIRQNSVICTTPPPTCAASVVCDSSGPSARLYVHPLLVFRNTTSTLHWNLSNVKNCSIVGTNGDEWGWGLVKVKKKITTGIIPDETTYTITCTNFSGSTVASSTKVYIVPKWKQI